MRVGHVADATALMQTATTVSITGGFARDADIAQPLTHTVLSMPEPELIIDALESLAKHPGWELVCRILDEEIARTATPVNLSGTLDQITVAAVGQSAALTTLRWMRNTMIEQAIRIERGKMQL